jgi:DNA-binding PadR family transcriptional regulator
MSANNLSPIGHVILGMLSLGIRTGYDIKQSVDRSTRFFLAASYGQIYPELKKLEDAGLIRGEDDPQGGRQRRAYDLTAEGRAVLDGWLADTDVSTYELRDLALLKLFFSDAARPDQRAALARAAAERHERMLAALEEVEAWVGDVPDPGMRFEVLKFGLDCHRWYVQRFKQMEQDLKEDR